MNIKISIKDCDCIQGITSNKQFSQVQHKKKTMLYAPPQSDKNTRQTMRQPPRSQNNKKQTQPAINTNTKQYRQSQQQMLNQLKKNNTNRATVNMVQNSNMILQKQSQILEQNQRTIQQIVNKNNKNNQFADGEIVRNQVMNALDQIQNQVIEIKKMRNQIVNATQDFNKNIADTKNGRNTRPQITNQIYDLNSNMKSLVQVSQNHLQGLENMQAIKNLQNFNIQGYTQAINTLKKQIAQYQKQSQNIQRELKIRTAKLEKLQLPPKFQEQLYKPYQEHLNNRIKNIDLHAIRQKIYDKIGGFDYGKFQADVGNIMIQAKNQLGNFNIICKQHAIVVPDIRIDQKQLKNLDIKLPSVIDQYKAERGIRFDDPKKITKQPQPQSQPRPTMTGGLNKTNQLQAKLKQTTTSKKPANLRHISTKPVDLAHQTQLKKQSDKRPTILQNQNKKQKKQLEQRIKKSSKQKKKEDEEFEKYLENRARQELQILYKQQKERLQKMQNQLYDQVQNPVFIDLNIKKQQVQAKKQSPNKISQNKIKVEQKNQQQQYEEQFQQYKKQPQIIKQQPNKHKNTDIKELGRDILKDKLKKLLGDRNKSPHITHPNNFIPKRQQQNIDTNGERQVQNIAEGFLAMINNTLTQVNNNLARSIEKKIQLNQDRRPQPLERKQPKKIQVPKLQAFRPPPVFNINLAQQPIPYIPHPGYNIPPVPPQQQKKIVVQNYDAYKLNGNDNYDEYQISSEEGSDDM